MSVDRDYVIKVSTIGDNAGALQTSEALKEVGKSSEQAGIEGKKAAEGMFDSHTELRHLLHGIGNDAVPGMGHAFSMLAMGPLGAVVALTSVVEFLKQGIADTNKKLDEMSANAAKAFGGGDWITDYVNATASAADETERLEEALRKAKDAGPEIKNRYDAETKAIQETVDALKAKLKAQEDLDLAAARKSGSSPEEMDAIRAHYESRSQAAQDAADQMEQQARQRELLERQNKQAELEAAARSKETPESTSQTRAEQERELNAQEAALGQATSDMNTKANDDLKEKLEARRRSLEFWKNREHPDEAVVAKLEIEVGKWESETAEGRAAAAKAKISELGSQVAKDKQAAAQEKSALDQATDAATENSKRVIELQKQIADANTAAKIKAESISQLLTGLTGFGDTKTFEKATGVDTDAGAADLVNKFLAAQSRLGSHQGTQGDQQLVVLLNRLLQQTQQSDSRAFLLLEDLIRHKGNLEQALADLARQMPPSIKGSPTGQ